MSGVRIPRFLRSRLWIVLLLGSLVLSVLSVPYLLSYPGQNEKVVTNSLGTFTLTPSSVLYSGTSLSYVTIQLEGMLGQPFTGEVTLYQGTGGPGGGGTPLVSHLLVNSSYFLLSFASNQIPSGSTQLSVFLGASRAVSLPISLQPQATLVWLDAIAVAIPLLFTAGVWMAPRKPVWMLAAAVPFYLMAAALFGQRFDLFFVASSGLRFMDHVNPFIPSASLPANLRWVYPPLYVPYSSLSGVLYQSLSGNPFPSNAALNFPGAPAGSTMEQWSMLVSPQLPLYFVLLKIPMVLATLGTYLLLRDRFQLKNAEKLWLLNPFVILVGVAWGQLDVMAAFCLALSVFEFQRGNTFRSSLYASVGAAIKIFPGLFLPFILIRSARKGRDFLPVLALGGLSLGLYALSGNVPLDLVNLFYTNAQPHFTGAFVSNGITWQQFVPIANFPPLLIYLFLPFYVYEVIRYWRAPRNPVPILVETFLVFFLTNNFVNPQYFLYPVLLLIISRDVKWALIFSAIPLVGLEISNSLTFWVNPYYSYQYLSSPMGQAEQLQLNFFSSVHLFMVLVVAATGIYLYRYVRSEGFHVLIGDVRRAFLLR